MLTTPRTMCQPNPSKFTDLRSGTNFAPDESILDPLYCPPEQVSDLSPLYAPSFPPPICWRWQGWPGAFVNYSIFILFVSALPGVRKSKKPQGKPLATLSLPLQYVLPTDSPHLAKSMFAQALSPVLWAQHRPDRFDTWSAGVCNHGSAVCVRGAAAALPDAAGAAPARTLRHLECRCVLVCLYRGVPTSATCSCFPVSN